MVVAMRAMCGAAEARMMAHAVGGGACGQRSRLALVRSVQLLQLLLQARGCHGRGVGRGVVVVVHVGGVLLLVVCVRVVELLLVGVVRGGRLSKLGEPL